jgi:hypothetical protein
LFDAAFRDALGGTLARALSDLSAVLMGDLTAILADFAADLRPVALTDVLADFLVDPFGVMRDTFAGALPTDFLRVFLDIRLPFFAFGGSVFGALRVLPGRYAAAVALGKSVDLGVWLLGIRRNPSDLAECAPRTGPGVPGEES